MFFLNTRGICRYGRLGRFLASVPGFLAVLFVLGCPMSSDGGGNSAKTSLKGTWSFTGQWGTEGYIIDNAGSSLTYTSDTDNETFKMGFSGTIRYTSSSDFTASSGVIIVEYDDNNKPSSAVGTFQAVYWKALKEKSVEMGNAVISTAPYNAEENNLADARAKFTPLDKAGTYIKQYGAYTR